MSIIISNFLLKVKDMQPFFSLEYIRDHCNVINWPNLNTVSLIIGRPEERERDRIMASKMSSQNADNMRKLSFPFYMTALYNLKNYNSDFKDH